MTEAKANFVYLADTLLERYPAFYTLFKQRLELHNVGSAILPGTRDIWAKDYMSVQNGQGEFIQFQYDPDYLRPKKWRHLRTDPDPISQTLGIKTRKSQLIIDGGNVIRGEHFVIMTDKIFRENRTRDKKAIIEELETLFNKQLIIIPKDPSDYTGHADGMVRFYKNRTVLISRYGNDDWKLEGKIKVALRHSGIDWIEVPYNPYQNKSAHDATGLYINYLQVKNAIFIPTFGLKEDEPASAFFAELFPAQTIVPIPANGIAKEGGVLNCISWNIQLP